MVGGDQVPFDDLRNSLERSSARETTMRVAVGAVAKRLLAELDMEIANHVVVFGGKESMFLRISQLLRLRKELPSLKFLLSTKKENRKSRTILTKSNVTVIQLVE